MRLLAAVRFFNLDSFLFCRAGGQLIGIPELIDDLLFLKLARGLFLFETGCFAFELQNGLIFLLRLLFGLAAAASSWARSSTASFSVCRAKSSCVPEAVRPSSFS